MKNKKIKPQKIIVIVVAGVILTAFVVKYIIPKPDLIGKVDQLKKQTKPMFDSLNQQINKENDFDTNIKLLIEAKDFALANKLVDTAIKNNPSKNILYTYKGMIYASQDKHSAAIEQYNKAISITGTIQPFTLSKRAESFLKLNDFTKAIIDYKKAATINTDFNYELGQTYEQAGYLDSAVAYYSKYLDAYPEKVEVKQRLDYLTSKNK